jgi:cysteinyl-tRNA synthetase
VLIAQLFDGVRVINSVNDGKAQLTTASIERLKEVFHSFYFDVLGLRLETAGPSDAKTDDLVRLLIRMRADAKARKDFSAGDRIRDELAAIGVVLKDTKDGTTWDLN